MPSPWKALTDSERHTLQRCLCIFLRPFKRKGGAIKLVDLEPVQGVDVSCMEQAPMMRWQQAALAFMHSSRSLSADHVCWSCLISTGQRLERTATCFNILPCALLVLWWRNNARLSMLTLTYSHLASLECATQRCTRLLTELEQSFSCCCNGYNIHATQSACNTVERTILRPRPIGLAGWG